MCEIGDAEREMRDGIKFCEMGFGPEVLLRVDPDKVNMIGGPGTAFCLIGRCIDVLSEREGAPTDYAVGSDMRTEVCRRLLRKYQSRKGAR